MTRFILVIGLLAVSASASARTKPVKHPATAPVPQAAQIAELNRKSLDSIPKVKAGKPVSPTVAK